MLSEIALEVHDPTIKSARDFTKERLYRDGVVRDAIRTTGDEKRAVDGLLNVAKAALEQVEAGDRGKWMDLADQSMKTLGSWTREFDVLQAMRSQADSRSLDRPIHITHS